MDTLQSEFPTIIDKALTILGLRGRTVANYAKISAEMKRVLGKTISATTIYRISNPRSSSYKPFQYSISLLEEFVDICEPQIETLTAYSNHLSYSSNPRDSILYSLLLKLLKEQEWQLINECISDINLIKKNLGQDRFSIAFALADYINKSSRFSTKDPFVQFIVRPWWFSLIYLETNIDFNNPKKYLKLIQLWLHFNESEKYSQKPKQSQSHVIRSSILFCYAIQPYLHFTAKLSNDIKKTFQALVIETDRGEIYSIGKLNPLLMTRILTSRILLSSLQNHKKLYNELCINLEENEIELIDRYTNSFEKAFSTTLILDTFLLANDKKRFIHYLSKSHLTVYRNTGDASINRLAKYIMWYNNSNHKVNLPETHIFLSDAENKMHLFLLKKAKQWLLKK